MFHRSGFEERMTASSGLGSQREGMREDVFFFS